VTLSVYIIGTKGGSGMHEGVCVQYWYIRSERTA